MMIKEYIEREVALDAITYNSIIEPTESDIVALTLAVAQNNIRKISAADVVEVVRCKNCANSKHWYADKRRCFLWCESGIGVHDNDYCSYGERG